MFNTSNTHLAVAILCGLGWSSVSCSSYQPNGATVGLTQPYYPPNAECLDYNIPVSISSENFVFNFARWTDDYGLEDFVSLATTRPSAGFPGVINGMKTENATYIIAATFCTPKTPRGDGKEKNIVIATHGIGPAREHWNSPFKPDEYNFVQYAIDRGYSVFFYDRLGCGFSDFISGFDIQRSHHSSVLRELAALVRSGQYTGSVGQPDKLTLMGFSFGSYITHFTIADTPGITDAVVLTGIGLNSTGVDGNGLLRSFVPRVAAGQDPERFGHLDDGYVTWVDESAQNLNYFKYPFYDPDVAQFSDKAKQAFSIGEFLTFPVGNYDTSNFTGAALTITGEYDYIVCDGYCPGIYEEPAETYYRNAKVLERHIHPDSSHHINFHHNATGAFDVIITFLDNSL
ncbi:alpha/beta-hydrolase [Polychaeton citri CBS 116435]|uniref:Alpha/beta-hydrolase n=1 Tax=Polychaeton citri CBS 116435 TaxID=1314669 RepID=A0A9P4UJT1_9PEZI|nr:alpha/beta-hydrolase [Polychaeton citri CBS 116435]